MADFEQKDMSGILFKNDKKGNDKAPDYNGNCVIGGDKLRISAWIKEGKGGKFMSLAFSEPYQSKDNAPQSVKQADIKTNGGFDDMADDIPFN